VASQAQTAATQGAAKDLFISHWSGDKKLGDALVALLTEALYPDCKGKNQDQDQVGQWVFYTSRVDTGLKGGEPFDAMLKQLDAAKLVVAIVTPRSVRSIAVQAEMTLAKRQGKLIPVAPRAPYAKLLSWPVDHVEAKNLSSEAAAEALVRQVGGDLKREVVWTDATREKGRALARRARWAYWRPVRWTPYLAVLALLLMMATGWGAYATGVRSAGPKRYQLTKAEQRINGAVVRLDYQNTFPARNLTPRLRHMWQTLGEKRDPGEIRRLFAAALRQHPTQDLGILAELVNDWRTKDQGLDERWASAVNGLVGPGFDRTAFDDTVFAVLRINGEERIYTEWKPVALGNKEYRLGDLGAFLEEQQ
jgi:hypothetical protein